VLALGYRVLVGNAKRREHLGESEHTAWWQREKNFEQVMEKMAAAARALGWPQQIVDATRSQMQALTKAQLQMMDQLVNLGRSRSNH
jgi:hypothetical protein